MSLERASAARRFFLPAAAAVALVASGPWIGQLRAAVGRALPGRFGLVVNLAVGAAGLAAIVAAVARVRERRAWRLAGLAGGVVIALVSAVVTASPSASQNAVERAHFIEYGLVTWLFYRATRAAWRSATADASLLAVPILCGLVVGTLDEAFQWFVPERVGEWRDVFLDLTAIAAGWTFSLGVDPPTSFRPGFTPGTARTTGVLAAAAVLLFAGFFHLVHLGHRIADPTLGQFDSRYTAETLLGLSRERVSRWANVPPPRTLPRLAREDQYLAEAAWHVQARNHAWESDVRTAWFENAILETYFPVTLDQPSYLWETARWPAEQRLDAERRKGPAAPMGFISAAARLDLYPWSPLILWGAAVLLAAAVSVIPRRFLLLH